MSWCEASHYGRPSPSALVGTIRTQFMFFFTPSDKKTGFRVLSKLCCFIKHFSFFLFLERREEEKEGNTAKTAKCSFALFPSFFFLLHFHFERCRLQLTTRSVQFV